MRRYLLPSAVLLLISLTLGCSPPGVSGTVTKQGSPVASGTVRFQPTGDAGEEFSTTINEGKYAIEKDGLAGDYKVSVHIQFADTHGAAAFYSALEDEPPLGPPGTSGPKPEAKKEVEGETFEFEKTLTSGANVVDLEIEG